MLLTRRSLTCYATHRYVMNDLHNNRVDPANTKRSASAGVMLAHRLRRWPNIMPALVQRVVLPGVKARVNNRTDDAMLAIWRPPQRTTTIPDKNGRLANT